MKKMTIMLLVATSLLIGCNPFVDDGYDIEGKNIGMSQMMNLITVFVEDNINGTDLEQTHFDRFYTDNFSVPDGTYEVEAYHVYITKDTKVIDDETGEELDVYLTSHDIIFNNRTEYLRSFYSGSGRAISVKVEEKFEPQVQTDRSNYILYDRNFLPIYTAEEIRVYPLTFDDFLFSNSYRGVDSLVIAIEEMEYEVYSNEYHDLQDQYWYELHQIQGNNNSDYYTGVYLNTIEEFELFNPPAEYKQYPIYIIFEESQLVTHKHDWKEVLEYFENK
ncbi:hypothetical protein ACERII_18045 [Evansella sp. AB-rgal1]|uniref:hypothetical protein n=1 Tax=Evansella sp. AB-rgal1 TaxID=3242696 RepID=UPI00359D7B26